MTGGNPAGMKELLDTFGLLAGAMLDDPLLALVNVVVWLDPLWGNTSEVDEGDSVALALSITRRAFPDIYAGAVERIRSGASESELERFICGAITERGIPLDDLEFLGYGIPLTGVGIVLDDPDLYTARPDLLPLVELFGIHPEPDQYTVAVPDATYTAGRIIANSLFHEADARWQQVGWALAWLFSCTGNTLIDYDDESLAEIPPLSWDEDDLAFAVELIAETEDIIQDVNAGLTLLEDHPDLLPDLSDNVQRVYKAIAKHRPKGKNDEPRIRLAWPPVGAGAAGAAVADPELLLVRRDAA
ncbi:MAG: hypothetical protein H6672_13405 [Anaerolineaceae bacterium]|nr:hypothetical protein [Anaerolineaceae bacterium]